MNLAKSQWILPQHGGADLHCDHSAALAKIRTAERTTVPSTEGCATSAGSDLLQQISSPTRIVYGASSSAEETSEVNTVAPTSSINLTVGSRPLSPILEILITDQDRVGSEDGAVEGSDPDHAEAAKSNDTDNDDSNDDDHSSHHHDNDDHHRTANAASSNDTRNDDDSSSNDLDDQSRAMMF